MNKTDSARIQNVQPPIIPIVADLIRSNPGTISLGQGVVYYGPPPSSFSDLRRHLSEGTTHIYGAVHGVPALRRAIAEKLVRDNKIEVDGATEIVVTAGSNMGFYNAILAIADPGDEIILSFPYYFNHEMAVSMLGCKPVLLPTENDYQLSVDKVAKAITKKTRAVATISPNNPTGAVYPRETLEAINGICRERGIYHISDEAYENFVFDGHRHFSPASLPGASEHTISLFSFSKSYGFAGWRVGYMVVPHFLYESIRKIQDTILICPPVICQYAALGAMQQGQRYRDYHIGRIAETRGLFLNRLGTLGDTIEIPRTGGAFYFLVKVHTKRRDMALLSDLISEFRVAAIPGSAFGIGEGCFLRIAYGSLQQQTAEEGINRLIHGLKALV